MAEYTCWRCGNQFSRAPYEVRNSEKLFCSNACRIKSPSPAEKLEAGTRRTEGCWLWTGAKSSNGYGKITQRRKRKTENWSTHRLAWIVAFGDIRPGASVLHKCDVRLCVRPDHLFLGTHAENMHDRNEKGRHAHGAAHPNAKITEEIVKAIRQRHHDGLTRNIMAEFRISRTTVCRIVNKESWRHVV